MLPLWSNQADRVQYSNIPQGGIILSDNVCKIMHLIMSCFGCWSDFVKIFSENPKKAFLWVQSLWTLQDCYFHTFFLTFAVLDWFSILFLSHLISLFAWLGYYTHAFMFRYINVWRMYQLSLRALFTFFLPVQGRRKVWKYRWAINNMVGIIYWSWLEEW